MRFHPNRRASTEKAPGPLSANARPMLPSRMVTQKSPGFENIPQSSITAARTPAIGVQRPTNSNSPRAISNNSTITGLIDMLPFSARTGWQTSPTPAMTRKYKRPTPGHPRAKFENNLRKDLDSPGSERKGLCRFGKTQKEFGNDSFEY